MRSAAVLALGLAVSATTLAGQQLVATERAEVVATIWAEARYNFAFWDRVRADWDSALSANLRLAAQPQSDVLFYRRLRRLVALLGDGQAAVVPPANLRSRIARPPLLLESVEQRPLIRDYAENDEMRVARPERLAEILAVQGIPAESWVRDSVLPETSAATPLDRWQRAIQWMLQGEKGTTVNLLLRLPGGAQRHQRDPQRLAERSLAARATRHRDRFPSRRAGDDARQRARRGGRGASFRPGLSGLLGCDGTDRRSTSRRGRRKPLRLRDSGAPHRARVPGSALE